MPSGMYARIVRGMTAADLYILLFVLCSIMASSPMVNPVRPFPMGNAIRPSIPPVPNGPNMIPGVIPAIKPAIKPVFGPA